MDLIEEVRDALKPLVDRGAVVDVRQTASISEFCESGLRRPLPVFLVVVDASNPRRYREEVARLINRAGLFNTVDIDVKSAPRA